MIMQMDYKILQLRADIIENIDYLSSQFQLTNVILSDLNNLITSSDTNCYMMFIWWSENEDSIKIINNLLKKLEN